MHRDGAGASQAVDRGHRLQGDHRPPGAVVSVFQADQGGGRKMNIIFPDRLAYIGRREGPPFARKGSELHPRQRRSRSRLVVKDMSAFLEDDFAGGRAMAQDRDLVALGAAGDQQSLLLAQHLCRQLLQPVDCGVLPVNIVAQLRRRHGAAHLWGGLSYRVAS